MKTNLILIMSVIVGFLLFSLIFRFQSSTLLNAAKNTRNELGRMNTVLENKQALEEFLPQKVVLEKALPQPNDVPAAVQAIAKKHGVTAQVNTIESGPGHDATLPSFQIKATGANAKVIRAFLTEIETESLFMKVTNLNLASPNGPTATTEATIEGVVYTR